jgi:PAS domain S-box-containing protein
MQLSFTPLATLRTGCLTVLRGLKDRSQPALLAVPSAIHPDPSLLRRLENEHALRDHLDPAWATRAMAFASYENSVALLLEDPGGELLATLIRQGFDLSQRLRIAAAVAETLRQAHNKGLIHGGIRPVNVIVNTTGYDAWLTGFGRASRTRFKAKGFLPAEFPENAAAYCAPETLGATGRYVDVRADLYAFGIVLFELLTGRLPFEAAHAAEWVHCHLARPPMTLRDCDAGLPRQLSDIVARLLEKEPDDRYQTASGVQADLLRCLAEWEASGRISAFGLAAHESAPALRIPDGLYGRDAQVGQLMERADRVARTGDPCFVLISGAPGCGKSALANDLRKQLEHGSWLTAAGKFDQYKKELPYSALNDALRGLVRKLPAHDHRLQAWQTAARKAVGGLGQLIVDAVPEAGVLIGAASPAPEVSSAIARARFHETLIRFIRVFAQPANPLLIFLDDLQWIDTATLDFLKDVVGNKAIPHLFLAGAYRDTEVSAGHKLQASLAALPPHGTEALQLTLGPLTQDAVCHMLADTLSVDPSAATKLAQILRAKADGNPLFLIQIMKQLADEQLVVEDPVSGRWNWDPHQVEAVLRTDDFADLLKKKVAALPARSREIIQYLACLGSAASAATIASVLGIDEADVRDRLLPAVAAGLVAPRLDDYVFVHDRMQEAAYTAQSSRERAKKHLRISVSMRGMDQFRDGPDAVFEIANQLNSGSQLLTNDAARTTAAIVNLDAVRRAKASGAYGSAWRYLDAATALRQQCDPCLPHALDFPLKFEAAHCELLRGNLARTDALLDELFGLCLAREDLVLLHQLQVILYVMRSQNARAVESALRCLRLFNINMDAHPTVEAAEAACSAVFEKLGDRPVECLIYFPQMTDREVEMSMDVLSCLFVPACFTDERLFLLHLGEMARLTLENGVTAASAQGLAWFGVLIGHVFGRYQEGYRFAKVAYELVHTRGFSAVEAKTVFALQLVSFWTRPLPFALRAVRQSFDAGVASGDIEMACYACNHIVTDMLALGNHLDEVWRQAESGKVFTLRSNFEDVTKILVAQQRFIDAMRGRTDHITTFDGPGFEEAAFERDLTPDRMATMVFFYWVLKGKARYIAGDFAAAAAAFGQAETLIWSCPGHIQHLDFHFFSALSFAALDTPGPPSDPRLRQRLLASLDRIGRWMALCPSTFADKHALLEAEAARLEQRNFDAVTGFEKAVRLARDNGFVHHEAIALERAAAFHRANGLDSIADACIGRARDCFLRWGAHAKVRQLDAVLGGGQTQGAETPAAGTAPLLSQADIAIIMDATRTLSSEIVLTRLIETVMSQTLTCSRAEFGALTRRSGAGIEIVATVTRQGGVPSVDLVETMASPDLVPLTLLHTVLNTRQGIILDDATIQRRFLDDRYIVRHRPQSVLCLPIMKSGQILGLLYLENRLASGTFTPARVAVLEMIVAQAAISLENARLYAELSEENRERRRVEVVLRDSEAALAQGQRISGTCSWRWNVRTGEVRWSSAFWRMFDMDPSEETMTLETFRKAVHPDDRALTDRAMTEAARRRGGFRVQYRVRAKDGSIRHFQAIGEVASGDADGLQYIGTVIDVSERQEREDALRRAHAELVHVARVHTLGQLASSVAHEVAQPLAAIAINGSAALRYLDRDEPDLEEISDALQEMVRDSSRAITVIKRIRALAKGERIQKVPISVHALISEAIGLLGHQLKTAGVCLGCDLSPGLPAIRADRVQLQQVLLNLLLNSIEALQGIADRPRVIEISAAAAEAGWVRIAVRDNGLGVSDTDRVFEPFFTTKAEGLGMGLSICRSIVEAHGGTLGSVAIEGPGAMFQLVLPIEEEVGQGGVIGAFRAKANASGAGSVA